MTSEDPREDRSGIADTPEGSRRRFIKAGLALGGAAVLAAAGYLVLGRSGPGGTTSSTSTSRTRTSTGPPTAFPSGKRFVIIPTLTGTQAAPLWQPDQSPDQVLGILRDLQPDTLHRYIGDNAALNPNSTVPGSSYSVVQFVQNSIDVNGATIIPKVTLRTYDDNPDLFWEQCQAFANLQVSPPLSLLSIDEWDLFQTAHGSNSISDLGQILDRLTSMGFDGFEVGACGATNVPSGMTSFSLFCVDTSTWEPEFSTLTQLKAIPSNRSFQLSIDYPQPLIAFGSLTPDAQAQHITDFASKQKDYGYSFIYPVLMTNEIAQLYPYNYDSTKVVTSSGKSMYEVMKALMLEYN